MAKVNYEELWNATESETRAELLLRWVKDPAIFDSDDGFLFIVSKMASLRALLNDPRYPNIQDSLEELETKAYDRLTSYINELFHSGIDLEQFDIKKHFKAKMDGFFAFTIFNEDNRFIDLMFDKKDNEFLYNFYRFLELMKNAGGITKRITSIIRKASTAYFANLSFTRSGDVLSDADRDNFLIIRMANYTDFSDELAELKTSFFLQIANVFVDIIDNPDEKYQPEIVRCFNQLDKFNDEILKDFVDYLQLHQVDMYRKIHRAIKKIAKDFHQPFPPRISEIFENKDEKSDHESENNESGEAPKPAKKTKTVLRKLKYFDVEGAWDVNRGFLIRRMLNSEDESDAPQIETALNNLAEHARKHLDSDGTSVRAKAGRQKYEDLVALFQELHDRTKSNPDLEGLERAREILEDHLDKDPKDSALLKNRRGFFGAYTTVSKCLNALGVAHFKYKERTAESTTDHLLIALLDTINEHLKSAEHSTEASSH